MILLADHIKVLGVTLDKHLTFDYHVNLFSKLAFYDIQAMRHIHSAVTEEMAKTVACALVGTWLNYANSVVCLQRAQSSCLVKVKVKVKVRI